MVKSVPKNLLVSFMLLCAILTIGTYGYVFMENFGWIDAIYMTIITLTTVGFGEINPLSQAGRVFTMFILLSGFGLLTYVITSGVSFMLEGELGFVLRRQKMEKLLKTIKDHFIICATGEIGEYVIEEFIKTKKPVVIITSDKELAEKLTPFDVPVLVANPAEDSSLKTAGIERAKGLISVLKDDKYNLFVVLSARSLNPDIRIVAQTIEKQTAAKIKKAGADEVVLTDAIGGMRMASAMLRPKVVSFLDTMLKHTEDTLRVDEATISETSELSGKTIAESLIAEKTGLLVLAVKHHTEIKHTFNPPQSYKIKPGDTLIVIGNPEQMIELNKLTC